MIRIIKEETKEDAVIEKSLKTISHWASSIDKVFAKSKEFKNVVYDFAGQSTQAHAVATEKLSELEKKLRSIYKEFDALEEKMLGDGKPEPQKEPKQEMYKESKYAGRYYVADDNYIPLREQPDEGYTALKAVERAQREAERAAKMFNEPISETRTWFHILDDKMNSCPELEKGI